MTPRRKPGWLIQDMRMEWMKRQVHNYRFLEWLLPIVHMDNALREHIESAEREIARLTMLLEMTEGW